MNSENIKKLEDKLQELEKATTKCYNLLKEDGAIDASEEKMLKKIYAKIRRARHSIEKKKVRLQEIEKKKESDIGLIPPTQNAYDLFASSDNTFALQDNNDDWQTILNRTNLSAPIKTALIDCVNSTKMVDSQAISLTERIAKFYDARYTNFIKYRAKEDLVIDEKEFLDFLEHSIIVELQKSGAKADMLQMSRNFILLIKGVAKKEDLNKEGKVGSDSRGGIKISFGHASKGKKLPAVTEALNKLPVFKKKNVEIDSTTLSVGIKGTATYKASEQMAGDTSKINDTLVGVAKGLVSEISTSFKSIDISYAIAEGGIELRLTDNLKGVLELKLMDFSFDASGEVTMKPLSGVLKAEYDLSDHIRAMGSTPEFANLLSASIAFEVSVTSELGVKILPSVVNKLMDKDEKHAQKLLQKYLESAKMARTVDNSQIEQLKKIGKQQNRIQKADDLLSERQKLQNEYNSVSSKKQNLGVGDKNNHRTFRRNQLKIEKELKNNQKQLKKIYDQGGTNSVDGLRDKLHEADQYMKRQLEKANAAKKKLLKKCKSEAAEKLLKNYFEKQAKKAGVKIIMKFIPGLNVLSTAMDIYDAYILYTEIRACYDAAAEDNKVISEEEFKKNHPEYDQFPVEDLPSIVVSFMVGIGKEGTMKQLSKADIEKIEAFLNETFPDGEDSQKFNDFIFNFGEYYDTLSDKEADGMPLLERMQGFHKGELEINRTQDGVVITEFDYPNAEPTNFFNTVRYKIVSDVPRRAGDMIKVDGEGVYIDQNGQKYKVTFPDDNLMTLKVNKVKGNEIYLNLIENYTLRINLDDVNGYQNYYDVRMGEGHPFVYDIKTRKITSK